MELLQKLEILADAAKYDASCASSGTERRHSLGKSAGIGSTEGMGICHAYAPDGRCISLLKILLTNACIYDCHYCINRRASNVKRARFTVDEVVTLTLGFYRRNCIEGLFLSSGIIRNPDYTMEQVVGVARALREDPRCRPAAARRSRPLRRPAEHQCRAADGGVAGRAGAGEEFAPDSRLHGPHAAAHRRGARGEKRAALRSCGAEHPGDRGRGRQF
jgi:hypothetical protein